MTSRNWTWLIVLVGIWTIRTCLILNSAAPFNEDAFWGYLPIADNIFHGRGYSMATHAPFLPTAYRPPGYAFFLTVFYCPWPYHPLIAIFVQCLFDGVTAAAIYCFGRLVTSDITVARLSCLLFLLYPYTLKFTATFFRDSIFAAMMTCAYLLYRKSVDLHSKRYLLGLAVMLGLSMYFREDATLYWVIFLGIWVFENRRRLQSLWKYAAIFLVSFLLILPWSLRNYKTFQQFILIASNDFTLINWPRGNIDITHRRTIGDLPHSMWHILPDSETTSRLGWMTQRHVLPLLDQRDADAAIAAGDAMNQAQKSTALPGQFQAVSGPMRDLITRYLTTFPFSFAVITMQRMVHYIFSTRSGDIIFAVGSAPLRLILAVLPPLIMGLGFAGIFIHRRLRIFLGLVLLPFFIMAASGWPEHRYSLPSLPIIFVGAVVSLRGLAKMRRQSPTT